LLALKLDRVLWERPEQFVAGVEGQITSNSKGKDEIQGFFAALRMTTFWSVAADSYFEAGADGEGQRRVTDGADVLLTEEVVELGEEGDVVGGREEEVGV
jgi:hypothetical protein